MALLNWRTRRDGRVVRLVTICGISDRLRLSKALLVNLSAVGEWRRGFGLLWVNFLFGIGVWVLSSVEFGKGVKRAF